jgi:NitT/TauT family transport system substrate-binding protein
VRRLRRDRVWIGAVAAITLGLLVATALRTTAGAARPAGKAVAGCGAKAVTDPADLSKDRKPARCESGSPAPKPLAQETTLNVSSSFRLEFIAPLLVGDSLGEFAKENLKLNIVPLRFSDAVPQLANGQIDVAVGGIEGALFNAADQGLPVKMTLGNYFPPDAGDPTVDQTGMWCRSELFKNAAKPKPQELKGKTVGSAVGNASASMYYVQAWMGKKAEITDMKVQTIPSTDMVQAMKNKALDCAILLDPLWTSVATDPAFTLVATQTPGEPVGGYFYGKNLLQDKPEVGKAFARAMIRTINTYLTGDYHQNPQVMDALSKAINQPVATIQRTPALVFDWEIRDGTGTRIQDVFMDLGVLTYPKPVSEKKLFDTSYYTDVVGAKAQQKSS